MRSAVAKPLHRLCGRSMVAHVLAAVDALGPRRLCVVVGPTDDELAKELLSTPADVSRVASNVRHDPCAAVLTALASWTSDDLDLDLDPDDDDVLVIPASVPLIEGETLRAFHRFHRASDATASVLVADDGPTEDDSSVWFVRRSLLAPALRRTDAPEVAAIGEVLRDTGHDVATFDAADGVAHQEILDRNDLAAAEAVLRRRINERWMRRGVSMLNPDSTYIDIAVEIGPDVTLFPGTVLRGFTTVGAGTKIGPGCHIVDSRVGSFCQLEQTSAELAAIGDHARVGPFAVLEPGSEVSAATVTGPFYTAGPDAR